MCIENSYFQSELFELLYAFCIGEKWKEKSECKLMI